jgi:hypothetical protein
MSNFDQMPRASTDSLLRCPERDTLGLPTPKGAIAPHGLPPADGAALGAAGHGARISRSPRWLCQPKFSHRQLARVTASRAGAHLTGAATSDQRLLDVRHTDPKQPRGQPSIPAAPAPADSPISSVPAATPSPHRTSCDQGTFSGFGIPSQ